MDLRVVKTRNSIINAFIELRSKKELEKITVKELCDLAMVNKSTFYSHFSDIYVLSEELENDIVQSILHSISNPESILENPKEFSMDFMMASIARESLIQTIFSGNRKNLLPARLEKALKAFIYEKHPEYEHDIRQNIILTYLIQGAFFAFTEGRKIGSDQEALVVVSELTEMILHINLETKNV